MYRFCRKRGQNVGSARFAVCEQKVRILRLFCFFGWRNTSFRPCCATLILANIPIFRNPFWKSLFICFCAPESTVLKSRQRIYAFFTRISDILYASWNSIAIRARFRIVKNLRFFGKYGIFYKNTFVRYIFFLAKTRAFCYHNCV